MASVMEVRTVDDARDLLTQLEEKESRVCDELDRLLEQQTQMDVRMASFRQMIPTLHSLHSDSTELCDAISRASTLAESVSSKVRLLDQAKSHVYAAMKRADDVIDLKSCADGFQYAMNSGDYEKAAAHIHRYLSLDESMLLDSGIADTAKASSGSSTVGSSFSVLRDNEQKLKDLVRERFREAVERDKLEDVERFSRLFPLLNLHEEGLDLYAGYLRSKMREGSEQSLVKAGQASDGRVGVVYADTLTLLYESTARLIEKHSPLVETYYGPDWTLPLIRNLQVECDVLVARILQQLQDERLLDHKVQTVSIALKARPPVGAIRPDVLELDSLLSEISICSSRTELYFRFIRRKVNVDGSVAMETGKGGINEVIKNSKTNLLVQELIGKYILLENYFMRESLSKAVAMDTCCPDGLTSSMADDIFFVLQKCIRRSFASSNVDGACSMLNHASSLLLTDYLDVLKARLKGSFPTTGLDLSGMLQSKLQSTRSPIGGDSDTNNKPDSIVTLNDIEVTIDNIHKLSRELQGECGKMSEVLGEGAKLKLNSCLAEFSSVGASFKELRQTGVSRIVELMIMSRITTTLEMYSTSVAHTLTDEELANYEVNDPFVQQLIATVETTLSDVKVRFLPGVYEILLGDTVNDLVYLLEVQVLKCPFNQLGGVQLDKDLRCLISYLSTLTQWPVRDKFARLLQLSTILSLDNVNELMEYWGDKAGPLMWRLTPMEVRKALRLRTDFRPEEIALLKL